MRRNYEKLGAAQGFSLVELMVALVIGMLIMAAVMAVMVNSNKNYITTDSMARLQENARFAMEFLTKDLRRAGYLGCSDDVDTISSTLNGGFAGGGGLAVQPLEGINNYTGGSVWSPSANAPSLNDPATGSDVIAIRYMDLNNPIDLVQEMPSTSARLFVNPDHGLQEGDIIMLSDCDSADVMQITSIEDGAGANSGKKGINHNAGAPPPEPGNSTQKLSKIYGEDATIMKFGSFAYYIRQDPVSGTRSLYRTTLDGPEELVEGIETMQILYGLVSTGDRIPTVYKTADQVGDVSEWRNVVSLRVAFVASTIANTRDGQLTTDTPTDTGNYDVNGFDYNPVDERRIRKVFTSTIMLRNIK